MSDIKLASFDIEISDNLASPGEEGWPPHIACAAIALEPDFADSFHVYFYQASPDQEYMTPDQVDKLVHMMLRLIEAGYTFLTWNGVSFDFPVVAANCARDRTKDLQRVAWSNHIDMMLWVTFQTGYRLSLDAALMGAGLKGKLHNVTLSDGTVVDDMCGAKAPELWCKGERAAVLAYLREDVEQPIKLARKIEKMGRLEWTSKKGRPMSVKVSELFTVKEAFLKLPEPGDISWMSEPILRDEYVQKYLSEAL